MEIIKSLNLIDNAGLTILILVCSMGFTALTKVAMPLENKYLPFVSMIFGIVSSHSYWVRAFFLFKNNKKSLYIMRSSVYNRTCKEIKKGKQNMALFKVSDGTNFIYDRTDTYTKELKNVSDYWHHLDDSRKMGVKGEYYGIRGYSSLKKARADNGTHPDKLVIFLLSNPITVLQLSKGIDNN